MIPLVASLVVVVSPDNSKRSWTSGYKQPSRNTAERAL